MDASTTKQTADAGGAEAETFINPESTTKLTADAGGAEAEQQGGGEDGEESDIGKKLVLTVKDQTGNPYGDAWKVKIKKETKLGKVFKAYADSKRVDVKSLRFCLKGVRLTEDKTPEMLELEDGDQINVSRNVSWVRDLIAGIRYEEVGGTVSEGNTHTEPNVIYVPRFDMAAYQREQESRVHPDLRAANLLAGAEAETADAGGAEAETFSNPETLVMLTMTTTSKCGCCRDEGSVELGLFEDPVDALAEARRRTANIMGLELRKNAKFTMKQYLSGVSGAEESMVCETDGLYDDSNPFKSECHGETISADGTGKVWCDDDPEGPSACGPMGLVELRIKKLPKIKRRKMET